jgi:hypothetical protein
VKRPLDAVNRDAKSCPARTAPEKVAKCRKPYGRRRVTARSFSMTPSVVMTPCMRNPEIRWIEEMADPASRPSRNAFRAGAKLL